jgi:hypothetical protein
MPRIARWLFGGGLLALGSLVGARPAAALSVFQLELVPPSAAGGQPLGGSLGVAIGSLPLVSNTTLELTGVSVDAAGGAHFSLDPDVASAGLGVLFANGSFLIPTLFLRIDDGAAAQDLAVPNVTGMLAFSDGGLVLAQLESAFDVDAGGMAGPVEVHVVATPEPAAVWLVAAGLAALAARPARREIAR